jgi:hypothetical protein
MKIIKQIDFSDIFIFAEKEYGISWNSCNDLFFNDPLTYKSVTDFYFEEWQGYTSFWKDESSFEIKAQDFSKEEVLEMDETSKAYTIMAAYCEQLGITDTVQIDCR